MSLRKALALFSALVALSLGGLYIVLPAIAGLGDTWRRLDNGEPGWLTAGLFLEIGSFFCYVALFRGVVGQEAGIGWAQSYRITLASLAATRLLAAGGVGGIALTAWALRRDGLRPTLVATRMATMLVLLYTVYMGAVVLSGLGLRTGVLTGPSPVAYREAWNSKRRPSIDVASPRMFSSSRRRRSRYCARCCSKPAVTPCPARHGRPCAGRRRRGGRR